jgi:Divergent InlB B-repeat domain
MQVRLAHQVVHVADSSPRRISRSPAVVVAIVTLAAIGFMIPGLTGATLASMAPTPQAHAALHSAHAAPALALAHGSPAPFHASSKITPRASTPPFSKVRMGHLVSPYTTPGAWGRTGLPPGSPVPTATVLSAHPSGANGIDPNQVYATDHCSGLFSQLGEAAYLHDCYGHDEPVMEFYSNQPGSGGNVSWNVTLPVDRNATANQSDLYSAMWFGMTMTDPFGWLDQCFLELQFYPDQSWLKGPGNGTANGEWIAAAVAWQIEATSGFENPCFYQPAFLHDQAYGQANRSYLNMTQGDRIGVTMTGWPGALVGENLSIVDYTNGQWANITLFNSTGNYPLDPAYATNQYENSLQWGFGEMPVTFAFETGHTFIDNQFGRFCSASPPPQSAGNPATPCPSYDPSSWVNDSLQPWHIQVPTYFNATARTTPASVSFEDDQQGIDLVDNNFGYSSTCPGNEGSSWCSYPWYSFSCSVHAFEFGATDYPGISQDFGKYTQYNPRFVASPLGYGYTFGTNFSIPACDAPSYSVTVSALNSGTGPASAYFLSQVISTTSTFNGLLSGTYAIHAIGSPGNPFNTWAVSGGVIVDSITSAFTTLTVTTGGTVTALFGAPPATATVTFTDVGAPGSVNFLWSINPGFGTQSPVTLPSGGSLVLASGAYIIDAYPPSGYNFSYWSSSAGSTTVAAPYFPISDLVFDAGGGPATVTAHYVQSSSNATLFVNVYGNGTVTLNGTSIPEGSSTYGFRAFTQRVGTYGINATPGPDHWGFSGIFFGSPDIMTNFSNHTFINLENGTSSISVVFVQAPNLTVTLDDAPAAGGWISTGFGLQLNGSVYPTYPGLLPIQAAPAAGYTFVNWTVSNGSRLWAFPASAAQALLVINGSGNLTAHYALAPALNLTFYDVPAAGGSIRFNYQDFYPNGSVNTTLTRGAYAVSPFPALGYVFTGWNWSGNATVSGGGLVTVVGAGGSVTANFSLLPPPILPRYNVSFIGDPPTALTGKINGTAVAMGGSILLPAGSYSLNASVGLTNYSFVEWTTTGGVSVENVTRANTTVNVTSGGAVYALGAPFVLASIAVAPTAQVDLNAPVTFQATVRGLGPFTYAWGGLPGSCPSLNSSTLPCTANAAGTYSITVTVTTPDGSTAISLPLDFTVALNPSVTRFNATVTAFDLSTTTTFIAQIAGGLTPYTLLYSGLPAGCATANVASLPCTPLATGTFTVELKASDTAGRAAFSNTTIVVNAAPQITTFTVSPTAVTVGIPANYTLVTAHGTLPFGESLSGFPASWGCVPGGLPPGPTVTFSCTPTSSGTFNVTVNLRDGSGLTASSTVTLLVNPAPAVTGFVASAPSFVVGNTTTLTVTATGGTGTLRYAYTGLPSSCASVNAATLSCTPAVAAAYDVTVTVTDAQGVSAQKDTTFTATSPVSKPPPNGNTAPTGGLSGLDYGIIALVAVLVVIGIVAAMWTRRKGRVSSPPEPWKPEEGSPPGGAAPPAGATGESTGPGPAPPNPPP